MSFCNVPTCPSLVEARTDIVQVVMLSASLNRSCACPRTSVTVSGLQSKVSGKYWRTRGVNVWGSWPALFFPDVTGNLAAPTSTVSQVWQDMLAEMVCTETGLA